jgi:hypothetical protein
LVRENESHFTAMSLALGVREGRFCRNDVGISVMEGERERERERRLVAAEYFPQRANIR